MVLTSSSFSFCSSACGLVERTCGLLDLFLLIGLRTLVLDMSLPLPLLVVAGTAEIGLWVSFLVG
jgi:hypothetical protein